MLLFALSPKGSGRTRSCPRDHLIFPQRGRSQPGNGGTAAPYWCSGAELGSHLPPSGGETCTVTSTTQIKAMSDACEEAMEKQGERVHHIEGHRGGTWLLMDFSSVVVHIFMDEARKFYDLERLWGDAEEIPLEDVLKDA